MFIAYVVVAALLAAALVLSASFKLRHEERAVHNIHEVVGVPLSWFPPRAACEIAGALGLLIGIAWAPIGIAAAAAVVFYMLGAIIGHLRVGDAASIGNPAVPLLLAIAALVTRILSA
ncbi:MAG TPA: DoxX family protein [Acidimicrobiia bacterium]